MSVVNPSLVQEIKNRLDLVEVIAEYLPLKKAGNNYKGRCPFHLEKTPSFTVSPEKQIFYCFGCHEGGDLFRFVMQIDKISFKEALEKLAQKAGCQLDVDHPRVNAETKEKEALLQVNRWAAWCYHQALKSAQHSQEVHQYLAQRGLTAAEIDRFKLGYVPTQGSQLKTLLEEKNIPLEVAFKAGVLRKGDWGVYEPFKGRLVFPIFNLNQKVIGLGGRILKASADQAKYINSPESPVYDKGSTLFGLNLAKEAFRVKKRTLIAEGYIDVITLHQYGFQEAVAPLGTALTERQILLLKRFVEEIILVFDGDAAGTKAALRSLDLCLKQEIHPKVALLPEGEDPDTFLRRNSSDLFEKRLSQAKSLLSFAIDKVCAEASQNLQGKLEAIHRLKPYFTQLHSNVELDFYLNQLADKIGIHIVQLSQEFGIKKQNSKQKSRASADPKTISTQDEVLVLEIFFNFQNLRPLILKEIDASCFFDPILKKLSEKLWEFGGQYSISEYIEKLEERELQNLVSKLTVQSEKTWLYSPNTVQSFVEDLLNRLKLKNKNRHSKQITSAIHQAEAYQDKNRLDEYLKQKQGLIQNKELTPQYKK